MEGRDPLAYSSEGVALKASHLTFLFGTAVCKSLNGLHGRKKLVLQKNRSRNLICTEVKKSVLPSDSSSSDRRISPLNQLFLPMSALVHTNNFDIFPFALQLLGVDFQFVQFEIRSPRKHQIFVKISNFFAYFEKELTFLNHFAIAFFHLILQNFNLILYFLKRLC